MLLFYTFSFPELVFSFTNLIGNVRKAILDADHVAFHTCGWNNFNILLFGMGKRQGTTGASIVTAILVLDSPVCVMCCRNINKCNKFSKDLNCVFVRLSLSEAREEGGLGGGV